LFFVPKSRGEFESFMTTSHAATNESNKIFHPAANVFPLMEGEEYEAFKESIASGGVQNAIVYLGDQIIDGRNRYLVCQELGIDPPTRHLDPTKCPDPVEYVIQQNLHRRHLSVSQRSMIAARVRELYEQQAKERQGRRTDLVENLPPGAQAQYGKARDQAGEVLGVSGKSVDHASKVLKLGSDGLKRAVDKGEIAVSRAAKIAELPPEKQTTQAKRVSKPWQNHKPALDHLREAETHIGRFIRTMYRIEQEHPAIRREIETPINEVCSVLLKWKDKLAGYSRTTLPTAEDDFIPF
jgi:hypothetical protein